MDVYIYESTGGRYLHLLGVTDRTVNFSVERLLCGGDKLKAVFVSGESSERLIRSERIIEIPEVFSGLITGIKKPADGGSIEVEAVSFSGLLSRRVLTEYEDGDSFMTVVERNCGALADEKRAFPNTFVDKSADCLFTVPHEYLKRSLSMAAAAVIEKGFRICSEIVHENDGARVRLYGRYTVDRSVGSGTELPVILSSEYDTLGRQNYSYSEKGTVSSALIYTKIGSGAGSYEWSEFFGESSGFRRCESSFMVSPVVTYSFELDGERIVYKAQLDEEAVREAAEELFAVKVSPPSEVISASLGGGAVAAMRLGEFTVGDMVTLYPDENGSNSARRITKIIERYENGGLTMTVFLDRLKREEI